MSFFQQNDDPAASRVDGLGWIPVRCCCQPVQVYGFLFLPLHPGEYRVGLDGLQGVPAHPGLEIGKAPPPGVAELEVREFLGPAPGELSLAVYGDDRPLDFWRRVTGFIEAAGAATEAPPHGDRQTRLTSNDRDAVAIGRRQALQAAAAEARARQAEHRRTADVYAGDDDGRLYYEHSARAAACEALARLYLEAAERSIWPLGRLKDAVNKYALSVSSSGK